MYYDAPRDRFASPEQAMTETDPLETQYHRQRLHDEVRDEQNKLRASASVATGWRL
jgi:hypothetical protein